MGISEISSAAKKASITLGALSTEVKNKALQEVAQALENRGDEIFSANSTDLEAAERSNLPKPLLKRLKFDQSKLNDVIEGISTVIALPDPVGTTLSATELDKDLELYKVASPIGVIGMIFESRPDALVQISTLCLKSGNSVLLKGGSEAARTNKILKEIIAEASIKAGLPSGWIGLLETRDDVNAMLSEEDNIDLIIPRGSNEFVRYIMENTSIPVLGHADGICHLYIDSMADIDMAVDIAVDSKTQYVAVCNALETLLVHEKVAETFLPLMAEKLKASNTEIRGCDRTAKIIECIQATQEDWATEYLDYTLSVKIVDSFEEAVDHINTYGSGHTDAVVTTHKETATRFLNLVDSADVFWNCSTRFSDGFRFGLGAEVGISTNKIHARGPVGMEGLMIYKYMLLGNGQTVSQYSSGEKSFTHRKLNKQLPL